MYTTLFLLTCLLVGAAVSENPYDDFVPDMCKMEKYCKKEWKAVNGCKMFGETERDAECKILYRAVYICGDAADKQDMMASAACTHTMPVMAKMMPCGSDVRVDGCPWARANMTMALVGGEGKWWATNHAGIVAIKDEDSTEERWGAICDDQSSDNEAAMVCTNYFGFAYGRKVPSAWFDQEEEMRFALTGLRCMNPYEGYVFEEACMADDYADAMMPCYDGQQAAIVCYNKPFVAAIESTMIKKRSRVIFKVMTHVEKHGIRLHSFDFAEQGLSVRHIMPDPSDTTGAKMIDTEITSAFRYKRRKGFWQASVKVPADVKEEMEEMMGAGCVYVVGSLDNMPVAASILTEESCGKMQIGEEALMDGARKWFREQDREDEEDDQRQAKNSQ